jgi:hypothetical protein
MEKGNQTAEAVVLGCSGGDGVRNRGGFEPWCLTGRDMAVLAVCFCRVLGKEKNRCEGFKVS